MERPPTAILVRPVLALWCRRVGHDWNVVSIDREPGGYRVHVIETCQRCGAKGNYYGRMKP